MLLVCDIEDVESSRVTRVMRIRIESICLTDKELKSVTLSRNKYFGC